jgi:DNA excision repair protein ERCC-5
MGVRGLWDLLAPTGSRVGVETLSGKRVAIDASIWLTQFVRAVRDTEAMTTVRNAHLLGIFRRCCKLLYYGIDAVFVFDGAVPALKRRTRERRRRHQSKQQARLRRAAERLLLAQLHASKTVSQVSKIGRQRETVSALMSPERGVSNREGEEFISQSIDSENGPGEGIQTWRASVKDQTRDEQKTCIRREHANQDDSSTSEAEETAVLWDDSDSGLPEDSSTFDDLFVPDPELLDADAIVSLPVSVQKEVIASIRRRLHSELVTCVEDSDQIQTPLDFSKLQLDRFMRTSQIRMKLRDARARASHGELAGRRLASDANREFLLIHSNIEARNNGNIGENDPRSNEGKQKTADFTEVNAKRSFATMQPESVGVSGTEWARSISQGPRFVHETPPLSKTSEAVQPLTCSAPGLQSQFRLDREGAALPSRRSPIPPFHVSFACGISEVCANTELKELDAYEDVEWDQAFIDELDDSEETSIQRELIVREGDSFKHEAASTERTASQVDSGSIALSSTSTQFREVKPVKTHQCNHETEGAGNHNVAEEASISQPEYTEEEHSGREQTVKVPIDASNAKIEGNLCVHVVKGESLGSASCQDTKPSDPLQDSIEDSETGATTWRPSPKSVLRQRTNSEPDTIQYTEKELDPATTTLPEAKQSSLTGMNSQNSSVGVAKSILDEVEERSFAARSAENDAVDTTVGPRPRTLNERSVSENRPSQLQISNPQTSASNTRVSEEQPISDAMEVFSPSADGERQPLFEDFEKIDFAQLRSEYRTAARQADSVTEQMFADTKRLLQLLGIPCVEAYMEAEAQCAFLNQAGIVDAVVTEDSDAFLFGARCVYRHIFEDTKYVEEYQMDKIERNMGLTRDKLICLSLLLGSDYSDGIYGVGIVNATEIVEAFCREPEPSSLKDSPDREPFRGLESFRQWLAVVHIDDGDSSAVEDEDPQRAAFKRLHIRMKRNWHLLDKSFPNRHVIEAFLRPQVDPSWLQRSRELFPNRGPDLKGLQTFCRDLFGWDTAKLRDVVYPVVQAFEKHRERQTRIDSFFQPHRFARIRSARLQRAVRKMVYEGIPAAGANSSQVVGIDAQQRSGVQDDVLDDDSDNLVLNILAETEELMLPHDVKRRRQRISQSMTLPKTKRQRTRVDRKTTNT